MVGAGIEIDYKDLVLEIMDLVRIGKGSRAMLELRVSLFVAACCSDNRDQSLLPFPFGFFDAKTKSKDFVALQENIKLIPPLDRLGHKTELPTLTWNLMYWVFTNPLTISPLFNFQMGHDTTELFEAAVSIEKKTKLNLPRTYFAFEVTTPHPKPAFVEGKEKYGTYFAFHGSPMGNFHSIIHRGLLSALNRRSAYGFGTYLSSDFGLSDTYSQARTRLAWTKSVFGLQQHCVAICEVVDAPTGLTKHPLGTDADMKTVTVVTDDDMVQLAYLLLSAPLHALPSKGLPHEEDDTLG